MKKTMIDAVKFETIIRKFVEKGLVTAEMQKGFVKVQAAKGRKLYPAATKLVGRCDLSGFEVELEGVRAVKKPFGAVTQELEFEGRTEDEILATFELVLEHMITLDELEVKRGPRAGRDSQAQGWSLFVKPAPDSSTDSSATA